MGRRKFVTRGPRVAAAVKELQDLILSKYPGTEFRVHRGEDRDGTYLTAVVDLDDPDEIVDLTVGRTMELLLDDGIFIVVVPVRTPERAAELRRHLAAQRPYASATAD